MDQVKNPPLPQSDQVNNLSRPQTIVAICSWSVLKPVT